MSDIHDACFWDCHMPILNKYDPIWMPEDNGIQYYVRLPPNYTNFIIHSSSRDCYLLSLHFPESSENAMIIPFAENETQ